MYFAHPESPRLNEIAADMSLAAADFDGARNRLVQLNNDFAAGLYGLRIDCREFGSISGRTIDRVGTSGNERISGLVISSLELIAKDVAESRCTAPTDSLVRLYDRVFALPGRTVVDRQTILIAKARLLESAGETDRAVETLTAAHELRQDDALPLYIAARALARVGRIGAAAAYLLRASEIEQQKVNLYESLSSEIYRVVGNELLNQGQGAAAADVFTAAVAVNPGALEFRLSLVDALLKSGSIDAASDALANLDSYSEAEIVENRRALAILRERIRAGS